MLRLSLLIALLAASASARDVSKTVSVDPVFTYLKLAPGESLPVSFTISNKGKATALIGLSRRDAWHADDGSRTFPEAGTTAQGLGNWLSAPKSQSIRLGPGSQTKLEGVLTVPADAKPRTYLGGYVLRLELATGTGDQGEAQEETRAGARMIPNIVLIVHADVRPRGSAPPKPFVEVVEQQIQAPEGARPLVVRLRLLNHSEFEVKPTGVLAILERSGRMAGKASFDPGSLWPGQATWFQATFAEPLAQGSYSALAAFSLNDPSDSGEAYSAVPVQRKVEFQVGGSTPVVPRRPSRSAEPVKQPATRTPR